MSFFGNLFGKAPKVDFRALVENGATILDVRTQQECTMGCINGSVNIPLNILPHKYKTINKRKPIIVYCASGMRSASAKAFLEQNGFSEVYDGGGIRSLMRHLG